MFEDDILCPQAHGVLKLLIQLLPVAARNDEVPLAEEKTTFLVNNPSFLQKFGNDLLHVLIQVGCSSCRRDYVFFFIQLV